MAGDEQSDSSSQEPGEGGVKIEVGCFTGVAPAQCGTVQPGKGQIQRGFLVKFTVFLFLICTIFAHLSAPLHGCRGDNCRMLKRKIQQGFILIFWAL